MRPSFMKGLLFSLFLLLITIAANAQSFKVYGKVTNNKLEPLAFATLQLKDQNLATSSREDGSFLFNLEVGEYNIIATMIGYQTQIIHVVVNKDLSLNIVMQEEEKSMEGVVIKIKVKDRAEEIIKNVIRNKDAIMAASGDYSAQLYIKATQQDSAKKKDRPKADTTAMDSIDLQNISMAEVLLHLDYASDQKIKEERLAVKKNGNTNGMFYLTATQGNFNFYNNLIKVPHFPRFPFSRQLVTAGCSPTDLKH